MDMIKRFVRYYKPHKRLFMLDTACSLMVAVCDLFYPMIAKNITNVYVPNKELRLRCVEETGLNVRVCKTHPKGSL